MYLENLAKYEIFIIVGIFMAAGTIIKLLGIYNFSSDWFWLLAGLGLMVEGTISLVKQRKFPVDIFREVEHQMNFDWKEVFEIFKRI